MRQIKLEVGQEIVVTTKHGKVGIACMPGEMRLKFSASDNKDYCIQSQVGKTPGAATLISEFPAAAVDVRRIDHITAGEMAENEKLRAIATTYMRRAAEPPPAAEPKAAQAVEEKPDNCA